MVTCVLIILFLVPGELATPAFCVAPENMDPNLLLREFHTDPSPWNSHFLTQTKMTPSPCSIAMSIPRLSEKNSFWQESI